MEISTTTGEVAKVLGSDVAALHAIRSAGFGVCDFSLWNDPWDGGIWTLGENDFNSYFKDLRSVSDVIGLRIGQAHAPFASTVGEAEQDAHRLSVIRRAILAAGILGSPSIVVHPAIHIPEGGSAGRDASLEYNLRMYKSLVPQVEQSGVKVALENLFKYEFDERWGRRVVPGFTSNAEDLSELLTALGSEHFCLCLDVGHCLLTGLNPAEMIRQLAPWLETLHIHDNAGLEDDHLLPYLGKADWDAICMALRESGYRGTLNLEADEMVPRFPSALMPTLLSFMAQTATELARRIGAA